MHHDYISVGYFLHCKSKGIISFIKTLSDILIFRFMLKVGRPLFSHRQNVMPMNPELIKTHNQSMHKNHKIYNKKIPTSWTCKLRSETYLVRGRPRPWATAREGDRERDGDGERGRSRDWEGELINLCGMIAILRGRSRDWEAKWEGDSEIERFGLWVCCALLWVGYVVLGKRCKRWF